MCSSDLKALLLKKEKKKKRRTVLFNSGRRFGNTLQNEEAGSSIGKGTPQEGKGPSPVVSDNETDFNEEQYPPAEDRYKQLEDRLNAMEIQQVPGLDFGDLGLSTGVIIPHKFKAPSFTKYDGASCPKLHLTVSPIDVRAVVRYPWRANGNISCHKPKNRVLPQWMCEPWNGTCGEQMETSHAKPCR